MGDLVPFPSHFKINWVAGTDLAPLDTMATKGCFLAEAREREYLIVLYHEHLTPVGRLTPEGYLPT